MIVNVSNMQWALDYDEFVPFFQPKVELRTGCLIGFEVLARWQHPLVGMVMPDDFIPVAEKSGLLPRLTHHIIRKALVAAAAVPVPLGLSINVSPSQLRDVSLPEQIFRLATTAGFPLDRLAIEITETALIDNDLLALEITQELKQMGCKLWLDDFGIGYSSLSRLQKLHFDGLKIDRTFIADMTKTRESRKIVSAMVGLGQSLGMLTIAEGVETEEQASLLLYLGCEVGQGWLYGRPCPAACIPARLAEVREPTPYRALGQSEGNIACPEALPAHRMSQLQAIYDGAPVGLCFLDRNFRYVSMNRQFTEINDTSPLLLIGHTVQEMFPKWFPLYEPYLKRALNGERLQSIEITRPSRTQEGASQTILISYEPARDEAGEVIGISMALIDITSRKLEEEALRESEERYRTLIDLNPQIPWIADTSGEIVDCSSRWLALTGMSREQSMGYGYLDAVHPEDMAVVGRTVKNRSNPADPVDLEFRVRRFDGRYIWMRSRGSPLMGPDNQVLRYYGSIEVIDEQKKVEEALRDCRLMLNNAQEVCASMLGAESISSRPPSLKLVSEGGSVLQKARAG